VRAEDVVVELRKSGARDTSTPLYTTPPISLTKDSKVDLIIVGDASSDPASSLRVLVLPEAFAQPAAGRVRIRFANASPDASSLSLEVPGAQDLIQLPRFGDSGAAGVDLAGATGLPLKVLSGTTEIGNFSLPAFPAGTHGLVVLTGSSQSQGGPLFKVLIAGWGLTSQNVATYLLQTSPDLPPVDVVLGNALSPDDFLWLAFDFSFGNLVRVEIPGDPPFGPLGLLFRSSADGTALTSLPLIGSDGPVPNLWFLWGFLHPPPGRQSVDGTFFYNAFPPADASTAKVRFFHAAADAQNLVDFGLVSGGAFSKLSGGQAFADDSVYWVTDLVPGTYTIGVRATGDTSTFFEADVTLPGGNYWLVLAGSANRVGGHDLQLLLVDASTEPWTVTSVPRNP